MPVVEAAAAPSEQWRDLRYRPFLVLVAVGIVLRTGSDVRLFSCSPDSRGLGTLRSDWMVDVWRLLDACRVSDVLVVTEAGLQTALGDDLDPAPSGIGHGNFFVFVDASARRNSRHRVCSCGDSVAVRRSSLPRAHRHGRFFDNLPGCRRHLGGDLGTGSKVESALASP